MSKEPYENRKCEVCGKPLEKQKWNDLGDMWDLRITCSDLDCNMEPYNTSELKGENDANKRNVD